jgi:5-methylcytosine-specific restriction endonuclease McrA
MKEKYDWSEVQRFIDEGYDVTFCSRRFGFTYGAWVKAIRRGRITSARFGRADLRRRHNWADIQAFYDEGHSLVECMERFHFSRGAWHKAVRRREIRPRPLARPLGVILAVSRSRHTVKKRLLAAGILVNRCDQCGITDWHGEPLSIQIDHINGLRDDHRIENLRMFCPNCHSQTATFGKRGPGAGTVARRVNVV